MLRELRRSPGFAAVAVLTLGLGIGSNTAIFSIVNTVLLEPLRYPEPDRVVMLGTRFLETGRLHPRMTGGDLVDIYQSQRVFEALSKFSGGEIGVQLGDHAEFTGVFFVDTTFFGVYGVSPLRGRFFQEGDAKQAAVVSAQFARRNFGSADAAVGRTLSVEGVTYQVAGVTPEGFSAPRSGSDVWIAWPKQPANLNRTAYNYSATARLQRGVSMEAAQAQMDTIAARLAAAYPDSNKTKGFAVTSLKEQMVGPVRTMLLFLLGAVSLVLLIACANVANLLLARATARSREFAVRVALGASRWQILRQLAAENAVLGLLGGGVGLLLVWAGLNAMLRLAPQIPRMDEVRIDPMVLLFAMMVSLVSSVLFGLAPALEACRANLNDALKQGGMRGLLGSGSQRIRKTLVVAEVALSVTLAVGAGLLFRSFLALNSAELGFRTEGILVMYTHVPAEGLANHIAASRHFEYLFGSLGQLPGVKSVAAAMGLPTGRYGSNGLYAIEGVHRMVPGEKMPSAGFRLATPGYFSTMGIPVKRGRDFSERDQYEAPFVAIISETLVRQSFPNEDPIGKRIKCGLDSDKWMTVIGVVGDVRQSSPAATPQPELYMPVPQHPFFANELQVVLRTEGNPSLLAPAVEQRMRQMSPSAALKFNTMEGMVSESIATPRFRTFLVGLFASVALLLAMAGIYGVMNYLVAQRTSEFGLRMALGADPSDVLSSTMGQAVRLTALGLALGVAFSFAAHRLVESMLYGLKPMDGVTYGGVLIVVMLVACSAAAIPAWRATRIDPIVALRNE